MSSDIAETTDLVDEAGSEGWEMSRHRATASSNRIFKHGVSDGIRAIGAGQSIIIYHYLSFDLRNPIMRQSSKMVKTVKRNKFISHNSIRLVQDQDNQEEKAVCDSSSYSRLRLYLFLFLSISKVL